MPNGEIEGVVAYIHEVTEQRRTREALYQAQKMESLGIMAGGIAHDFNNLLIVIMGQSSLALTQLDEDEPAYGRVEKILSAAGRAADITRQMLNFAGQGRFEKRPLNLNDLLRENLAFFQVTIPKQIKIELNLAEDIQPIMGEAGQIQQVVMNLILNAADAIGEHSGTISVSTRLICIQTILKDDHWLGDILEAGYFINFVVSDNGKGMDEETLSKIFDPFYTTKSSGRGLGLAAVLGIVRGHGGALNVVSQEEEGTKFSLLLPIQENVLPDNLNVKRFNPQIGDTSPF